MYPTNVTAVAAHLVLVFSQLPSTADLLLDAAAITRLNDTLRRASRLGLGPLPPKPPSARFMLAEQCCMALSNLFCHIGGNVNGGGDVDGGGGHGQGSGQGKGDGRGNGRGDGRGEGDGGIGLWDERTKLTKELAGVLVQAATEGVAAALETIYYAMEIETAATAASAATTARQKDSLTKLNRTGVGEVGGQAGQQGQRGQRGGRGTSHQLPGRRWRRSTASRVARKHGLPILAGIVASGNHSNHSSMAGADSRRSSSSSSSSSSSKRSSTSSVGSVGSSVGSVVGSVGGSVGSGGSDGSDRSPHELGLLLTDYPRSARETFCAIRCLVRRREETRREGRSREGGRGEEEMGRDEESKGGKRQGEMGR